MYETQTGSGFKMKKRPTKPIIGLPYIERTCLQNCWIDNTAFLSYAQIVHKVLRFRHIPTINIIFKVFERAFSLYACIIYGILAFILRDGYQMWAASIDAAQNIPVRYWSYHSFVTNALSLQCPCQKLQSLTKVPLLKNLFSRGYLVCSVFSSNCC